MRIISADSVRDIVSDLCIEANLRLRNDVLQALKAARLRETNKKASRMLEAIIKNASIAKKEKLALCQDTGLPSVFVEMGRDIRVSGDLKSAINKGAEFGYKKGFFRDSVVKNPLLRGRPVSLPAVTHIDVVKGDRLKITVLAKGFGCENKTRLRMFNPTAELDEVKKFIIDTVKLAGPDACPPYIVGIGIGGTADYACLLAKKALLKKLSAKRYTLYAKLELDLLEDINKLGIGPMGLGGKTTALAVNIETYSTHIAGLPVCVNINCHALRSAVRII